MKKARSRRSRASSTRPWRRGVDLDDVEAAATAGREGQARVADAARRRGRALLAVQAAGQDPRAGRLAAAARAAEQVGVVGPVVRQRLLQRTGDVVLADDVGEGVRPVAAVQRLGHGLDPSRAADVPQPSSSGHRDESDERTPRTPARACLPLLPSGPGGVQRDDAARGVADKSNRAAAASSARPSADPGTHPVSVWPLWRLPRRSRRTCTGCVPGQRGAATRDVFGPQARRRQAGRRVRTGRLLRYPLAGRIRIVA